MQLRSSVIRTQTAADATVGKCLLTGFFPQALDAATTYTILDGAVIKFTIVAAITTTPTQLFMSPLAFTNLVVDQTGTGNWSVSYIPAT